MPVGSIERDTSMRKTNLLTLIPVALALTGCFQDDSSRVLGPDAAGRGDSAATAGKPDSHYLKLLEARGYPPDSVEIFPEGFVVEGDIFIPKADLDRSAGLPKAAQRLVATVSAANANKIRIRVHPSISAWTRDIHQAIHFWNSVQSGVFLNLVTTGGDIVVAADTASVLPSGHRNLASDICGRAGFPSGGAPFGFVSMNIDQSVLTGDRLERISVIAHEIGHTIGFAHTNNDGGTLIEGTPETDNSIMNGSSCGIHDDNLSDWDRKALHILYPKDVPVFGTRIKDGDFRDDIAIWRPSDGFWKVRTSASGFARSASWQWGERGDIPLSRSDFDGDGLSELAVWRPATGNWAIGYSKTGYTTAHDIQWGQRGDQPMPAMDIDRDNKADLVVYRWSDGMWHIRFSSSGFGTTRSIQWGDIGDIPVADADMDRDGWDDIVVWRPSEGKWYWRSSSSDFVSTFALAWGLAGDVPMAGTDYDGDNRDDITTWRPSTGSWAVALSSTGFSQSRHYTLGLRGDLPLPESDFDGDGRRDLAVWRRDDGNWLIRTASSGFASGPTYQWGR